MRRALLAVALALGASSCGYRPLAGRAGAGQGLGVVTGQCLVADRLAAAEMLQGAREALVREGAYDARARYPRLELDLLRVDELGEGIAEAPAPARTGAGAGAASSGPVPLARGARLVVTGRARLVASEGAAPSRDTGDVRASVVTRSEGDALSALGSADEATRAAARALGRRVALLVVGEPGAAGEE